MNGTWLLLPVLLPMAGGLVLFRIHKKSLCHKYTAALLLAEAVLVTVLVWGNVPAAVLFPLGESASITLACDGVSRLFALLVSYLWLIVGVFSFEYMDHEERRTRFFAFYLMTMGALVGICFAGNLITLYLFYEMMTLLALPLVIHSGTDEAMAAGLKYLGFSLLGAGLGLLGLFFLQRYSATDLFTPGGVLDASLTAGNETMLLVIYLVMMIGFGCKTGMFPLFTWLPTAHPVAPSPASAILSGLLTKMGVLAIIRVTYFLYGTEFLAGTWVQKVVVSLALLTVFVGSMLAYKEKGLKRRLAYSTVSQVSYILFGLFLLTPTGVTGALYQVVFHAMAKSGLFLAAGALICYTGHTKVEQLRGVGKRMPAVMWAFTLCSLSLIGIPPVGGFVSKWYLAQGALGSGLGVLGEVGDVVLVISALLTAGYLLPISVQAFFPGEDFDKTMLAGVKRPTKYMTVPLLLLGLGVLVLGILPGLLAPVLGGLPALIFR